MKVLKILMKLIGINSLYRYKLMPFRKLLGYLLQRHRLIYDINYILWIHYSIIHLLFMLPLA